MPSVYNQLSTHLAHLAWSLWTELGVAGLKRHHQNVAIAPEELILLTAALSDFDPRLRDEALDWCLQYHHLISPMRLHTLAKKYQEFIEEPFSSFATTVNSIADLRTKWPTLKKVTPLNFRPSKKSKIRDFKAPSMLHFRLRSFLGVGARADALAFFLIEASKEVSASDLVELGYSKRRLSQILNDLADADILSQSQVRNQLRYTLHKKALLIRLLGNVPKKFIPWDQILAVLLPLQTLLHKIENTPIGIRVIDMRNLLVKLSKQLMHLHLTPPPLENDFELYWNKVTKWILDFAASLAQETSLTA